ncbi:hypothetical protein DRW41_13670 [Neobacillus piezotolerans]|uniref:YbxH family protein n=1 Tax=Neobacillus piezotolerans TaxID=2259171 RepID=A0A3D8GQ82_9BACI|nr:YbxH family protein [Neobacillus piezotolerans]RDU36598.1 hypothetical protein DRW41_13670 [Neobacillus piezotolerans]
MGAIDKFGYRFEPEFSVISQNGAIHVYKNGEFIEEIKFTFSGKFPVLDEIEQIVDEYCHNKGI